MAVKSLPAGIDLIQHSDRGIQYCCHAYRGRLRKVGARINMTEENHVYENAIAERLNGILKKELELPKAFNNKPGAPSCAREG